MSKNTVEASYVRLLNDIKTYEIIRMDPKHLVKTVKDITAQSFGGKNIFEHHLIDATEVVKIVPEAVPNQITQREWEEGYCGIWSQTLPGMVIPVKGSNHMYWKFRIVVSCEYWVPTQISVQMLPRRKTDAKGWITIPASTSNVLRLIEALLKPVL